MGLVPALGVDVFNDFASLEPFKKWYNVKI